MEIKQKQIDRYRIFKVFTKRYNLFAIIFSFLVVNINIGWAIVNRLDLTINNSNPQLFVIFFLLSTAVIISILLEIIKFILKSIALEDDK